MLYYGHSAGKELCTARGKGKGRAVSSSSTVSQLYKSNHSYFLEITSIPSLYFLLFSLSLSPFPRVRNGSSHHSGLGRADCAGLQFFLHVNTDGLNRMSVCLTILRIPSQDPSETDLQAEGTPIQEASAASSSVSQFCFEITYPCRRRGGLFVCLAYLTTINTTIGC